MKTVAIVSGGMDSSTLAWQLHASDDELIIISFDYGQRHVKELLYAEQLAEKLGDPFYLVRLKDVGAMFSSALTSDIEVPEGHYAADNMASTVVPNRNAIMLSIAFGLAVDKDADRVAFAAHAGDHPIYPDCRPAFVRAFTAMEQLATEGYGKRHLQLFAPYINITKADIVKLGNAVGVPYAETWSCYKGGGIHCGRCGTCVERKEAFRIAEVPDPTEYEDEVFEIAAYRA